MSTFDKLVNLAEKASGVTNTTARDAKRRILKVGYKVKLIQDDPSSSLRQGTEKSIKQIWPSNILELDDGTKITADWVEYVSGEQPAEG